jgi:plasmid maintenance system antidote protein VapI
MNDDYVNMFILGVVIVGCVYIYFKNDGEFDLKCIISQIDGSKYCVRERSKLQEAADLLASVTNKCTDLKDYLRENHNDEERVQRLVKGFSKTKISETLPTSKFTAYSENKGEKIAFCLNKKKKDNNNLIDEHTLMFVAIHEMAHIMTESIGHKDEFWENFQYLLEIAEKADIHKPRDYKKEPQEYCGMTISDNPYYDH